MLARDESLVRWTGVIVLAMLVMLCLVLRPHPDNRRRCTRSELWMLVYVSLHGATVCVYTVSINGTV